MWSILIDSAEWFCVKFIEISSNVYPAWKNNFEEIVLGNCKGISRKI